MKIFQHLTKRTEGPKYLTNRVERAESIIFLQKFKSVYTKNKYVVCICGNVNWTQQVKFVKNLEPLFTILMPDFGLQLKSGCM